MAGEDSVRQCVWHSRADLVHRGLNSATSLLQRRCQRGPICPPRPRRNDHKTSPRPKPAQDFLTSPRHHFSCLHSIIFSPIWLFNPMQMWNSHKHSHSHPHTLTYITTRSRPCVWSSFTEALGMRRRCTL